METLSALETTLDQLASGERGIITGFDLPEETSLRLMELGFLEGNVIQLIRFAPLKDPIEVRILNSRISIRRAEAGGIRLKRLG